MARNESGASALLLAVLAVVAFIALSAVVVVMTDAISCYRFVPVHEHNQVCDEHVERAYRVVTASTAFISAAIAGMIAIMRS